MSGERQVDQPKIERNDRGDENHRGDVQESLSPKPPMRNRTQVSALPGERQIQQGKIERDDRNDHDRGGDA